MSVIRSPVQQQHKQYYPPNNNYNQPQYYYPPQNSYIQQQQQYPQYQQYTSKQTPQLFPQKQNKFTPQPIHNDLRQGLKKSPIKQLTFIDLFRQSIEEYEQKHTMVTQQQITQIGQSYTLYEDLRLIILMNQDEDNQKSIKQISEEENFSRSYESLKTRHHHFLKWLRQEDLYQIYMYIKQNGLEGYLVFGKDENNKKYFKEVAPIDQRLHASKNIKDDQEKIIYNQQNQNKKINQQQQNSAMRNLALKKRPLQIKQEESSEELSDNNEQNIDKQSIDKEINDIESQTKQSKKVKLSTTKTPTKVIKLFNENQRLRNLNKKKSALDTLSKKDKYDAEELDVTLTVVGNWLKIQKKVLVQKLHEVSGDLNQLDEYLNTKNEQLLWSQQDDQDLQQTIQQHLEQQIEDSNSKNNENNQQKKIPLPNEIKLLIRYKGKQSVIRRINYLELPNIFEF